MSTPESIPRRPPRFVPKGATCRCPYCTAIFTWPPEKLRCPACQRLLRPLEGMGSRNQEERRKSIEQIQKAAERHRRNMGDAPSFTTTRKPGFMVMVIVGLVLLGSTVISTTTKQVSAGKRSHRDPEFLTRADIATLAAAMAHYREDVGHYPSYQDGGVMALVSNPGEVYWHGPYINGIQNDGWRRPYHYTRTNGVPVLLSAGPDRQYFTEDDFVAQPEDFTPHPEFIRHDPVRRGLGPPSSILIDSGGLPN